MPDPITTPNKEGLSSAIEAFPGASAGIVMVILLRGTKWALDETQASAVVAVASWASSYVFAFARESIGGIMRAFGKGVSE